MKSTHLNLSLLFIASLLIAGCDGCSEVVRTPCDCETWLTTRNHFIASQTNTSGSWSTYEYNGGSFTADAACHARMKLTFFWVDAERNATDEIPPITPSFEAGLGYFNHQLPTRATINIEDIPVSAWQYVVSEAADRENPESTSYQVNWTYDQNYSPPGEVYVEISISYDEYNYLQYDREHEDPCN